MAAQWLGVELQGKQAPVRQVKPPLREKGQEEGAKDEVAPELGVARVEPKMVAPAWEVRLVEVPPAVVPRSSVEELAQEERLGQQRVEHKPEV